MLDAGLRKYEWHQERTMRSCLHSLDSCMIHVYSLTAGQWYILEWLYISGLPFLNVLRRNSRTERIFGSSQWGPTKEVEEAGRQLNYLEMWHVTLCVLEEWNVYWNGNGHVRVVYTQTFHTSGFVRCDAVSWQIAVPHKRHGRNWYLDPGLFSVTMTWSLEL